MKKMVATGILICALVNSMSSGMMLSVEASGMEYVQENEQYKSNEQITDELVNVETDQPTLEGQKKENETTNQIQDEEKKPTDQTEEQKKPENVADEEKKPIDQTEEQKKPENVADEEKKPEVQTEEQKKPENAAEEEKKPIDQTEEQKKPENAADEEKQPEEQKDYSVKAVVNGVEVTLNAPKDAFPAGSEIELKVEEITDERLEQAKEVVDKELAAENKILSTYRLFDVTPMSGQEAVQPLKPVQVTFKNLELKKEGGQVLDMADSSENTVMYHFMDEKTPEKMVVTADAENVITEWDHFSWMLAGELSDSGKPYSWNYEDEGGEYTLDYILNNYNVFISGDYLGSHVVGPMVVGGDARGTGFGGLAHNTDSTKQIHHTAPSYFEGYLHKIEGNGIVNITTGEKDLPVYLGKYNFEGANGSGRRTDMVNNRVPFFTTPDAAYTGTDQFNYEHTYVDFKKAFPSARPLPRRNTNPPGQVTNSRPSGPYNHNPEVTGRYEWLKGEKDGKVDVSNDGLLYGDEHTPGTIKYYQNFEGYDLTGHKVSKVTVTKNMIQDVLTISNNLPVGGRSKGFAKYYDADGNEVKELENEPVEVIEGNVALKDKYAFVISTKNMNLNSGKKFTEVSLRIRPGNNFTLESTDLIRNLIYDYKTEDELRKELTIVQTLEEKERLVFPSIYKSRDTDNFGINHQFGSIEDGGEFSVLFFAPNVEQVYVGFTDENTIRGPQLTGHLIVPQADVWLAGGNYNGTVIARNVDARGTEGHMWHFKGRRSTQALDIHGKKYVDMQKPVNDEIFTFKATLEEIGSSPAVVKTYTTENKLNGGFYFHIRENDLKDNKSYRVTVQEEELKPEHKGKYVKDPVAYVGEFTVNTSKEGVREPIEINWIRYPDGIVDKNKGISTFIAGDEVLQFNNRKARSFKINKSWKDEKGQPIANGDGCPDVLVDLYRSSKMPDGHNVTLKLYSGTSVGESATGTLFHTVELGQVAPNQSIELNVECLDPYLSSNKVTAGVAAVEINGKRFSGVEKFGKNVQEMSELKSGGKIKTTITKDTEIHVFFAHWPGINYGTTGVQSTMPTIDMFKIDTSKIKFLQPIFDTSAGSSDFYETRTLSAANNWELNWDGLPMYDEYGLPYFYKVVEHQGNYDTEYDTQIVSFFDTDSVPEMNITNTKKAFSSFNLRLNKIDSVTNNPLKNAEFALYKKGSPNPIKFASNKAGEYEYTENTGKQTSEVLMTVGEEGNFMVTGLPVGEYVLKETKAPNGYKKEQMELQFKVNNDESFEITNPTNQKFAEMVKSTDKNGQYDITYKNKAGVKLPATGGEGFDFHQIINGGLLMMIICFSILYYENKKMMKGGKKKNNRKTL